MCKISKITDVDFSLFVKNSNYLYEVAQKCGYKTKSNLSQLLQIKLKKE